MTSAHPPRRAPTQSARGIRAWIIPLGLIGVLVAPIGYAIGANLFDALSDITFIGLSLSLLEYMPHFAWATIAASVGFILSYQAMVRRFKPYLYLWFVCAGLSLLPSWLTYLSWERLLHTQGSMLTSPEVAILIALLSKNLGWATLWSGLFWYFFRSPDYQVAAQLSRSRSAFVTRFVIPSVSTVWVLSILALTLMSYHSPLLSWFAGQLEVSSTSASESLFSTALTHPAQVGPALSRSLLLDSVFIVISLLAYRLIRGIFKRIRS